MLYHPTAITAAVTAAITTGATLLASRPDHHLARSAGIISVITGVVGAATAVVTYRIQRLEDLGVRIATVDQAVLDALTNDDDTDEPPTALP